ncbi:MAG TPA: TonB-dependent receptor [Parasegetibacter sp.]
MKLNVLIFTTLLAIAGLLAQAQDSIGTVAGKVMDAETNELLAGLTISCEEGGHIFLTDKDGRYNVPLKEGSYTFRFEYIGYQPKTVSGVEVKNGLLTELDVSLEREAKVLDEVVITFTPRKESVAAILNMQRANAAISDGVSMETIKKSPDKSVGEALKRVSGTSIQDDKFVVVRGLSDRYNVALINGTLLPSTEPDRRAFSFDIVPSNLIDNILINKTASPDLPGDFSGGVIQVLTKDIPFDNFGSVSVGLGYNSQSTGKAFRIGLLENTDYLGFDNGRRSFPENFPSTNAYRSSGLESRLNTSRLMKNNYAQQYGGDALPSFSLQGNWGFRKLFDNGGKLGSVLSLTYRNSQTMQSNIRREYQTPDKIDLVPANLYYDYSDTTYSFNTSIGAMANFAYHHGQSKFAFKNLLNRSLETSTQYRQGNNYDNRQFLDASAALSIIKTLINSQIEGEHSLTENSRRIKWNLNYTLTFRDQPDYRILPYSKSLDDVDNKAVPFGVSLRDTYRFWSELREDNFGGQLNYSHRVNWFGERGNVKAGVSGQYKLRDFSTRIFRYEQASHAFNNELLYSAPGVIFNDGYITAQGFVLNEITNNTDRYDATSGTYAGYLMYDGRITEKLRAVVGVRIENFQFDIKTSDFSGQKVNVSRTYMDVLPSLNLSYSLADRTNLRFSASRTVSRPEFREVANFAYYDFQRNAQIKGNTQLDRAEITNVDLRFETYPSANENLSVSLFSKHFSKPIEQVVYPGSSPGNLILSFINQKSARSYGVEAEVRKNLSFVSPAEWLENLVLYMNAAYIFSTVDFAEGISQFDVKRPMQGQSPYLLNVGLQYSTLNKKLSLSALFNRTGPRIVYSGFQGYADVYENARSIIDIQASYKILKDKAEIKLGVSDLLNQRSVFYQNVDLNDNKGYSTQTDRIQYGYQFGRNISVGVSYNL